MRFQSEVDIGFSKSSSAISGCVFDVFHSGFGFFQYLPRIRFFEMMT